MSSSSCQNFDGSNSMNDLLLSLRVISKIQANERLGQRVDGMLCIEKSNHFLCKMHRYLRGDSRAQSMREFDRVITHAREKANDLLSSRHNDSHALNMLEENLTAAIRGMKALQQTYSNDANIVACIDQFIVRTEVITSDIKSSQA